MVVNQSFSLMCVYNNSQSIINPTSPGLNEYTRRNEITRYKSFDAKYQENIGFSQGFQLIHLRVTYRVLQIVLLHLQKQTSILTDLHTFYTMLFSENIGFSGCSNFTKIIFHNITYELTNISYVDRFQNNLYSQVTGKQKNMYQVISWCFAQINDQTVYVMKL